MSTQMVSAKIKYSDGKTLTVKPAALVSDGWHIRLGTKTFGVNTCVVAVDGEHAVRMAMDQARSWRKEATE